MSDAAHLFRLALEKHEPGARYNATAEEGIAFRKMAEAVGHRLGLPVKTMPADQAKEHFGWLMTFADKDMSAASAITRQKLGWNPTGPGLLDDLAQLELATA